jgi:SNF2 family DNA or RNA helicase
MANAQVSAKHKVFMIPFDQGLANIVPGAKQYNSSIILPHTRDTVRLARNMGHVVPAPIITQYDWNGDSPFRTQMTTAAMLTMQTRAYVLSEMGTGKTRATLHAASYMMMTGDVRKALVIAPLSTLVHVWDREIFKYFNHLRTGILHGSKAQRLKVLAQDHDIYIINHDGVETILPDLISKGFDLAVIDELAAFRNARTDRWKALNLLVNGGMRKGSALPIQPIAFAWGLTGSPTPNEPSDAWGQCRLLSPNKVPPYFKQFKRMTMTQVSQFKWIPKPEANEIVFEAMQPAVRYKRDDCVELPDVSYQNRPVTLSAEQKRVYSGIMKKLKLGFQEGTVTAANEGVLFSKLLQIASGWVYTTDRKVVALDNQDRMDQLLEVLDESEGKVIVFVDFIHAAKEVHNFLLKSKVNSSLVTGETPANARNHIFNAFQSAAFPRVLVAHPKCMAHGLTLTAANTICWFTPTTSLETYEQACARITRPGQTRKSLIVHLTGTPVESKLYKRLQQKATTQGALLELFELEEALVGADALVESGAI